MINLHPQYIIDLKGKKLSVVLPVDEFERLMEELEDMEDIRLYDEAKTVNEPSVPIDEAFAEIEKHRNK